MVAILPQDSQPAHDFFLRRPEQSDQRVTPHAAHQLQFLLWNGVNLEAYFTGAVARKEGIAGIVNPHIARVFVTRASEVQEIRALRAKLFSEIWDEIVLKYVEVQISENDPKILCLRRS